MKRTKILGQMKKKNTARKTRKINAVNKTKQYSERSTEIKREKNGKKKTTAVKKTLKLEIG